MQFKCKVCHKRSWWTPNNHNVVFFSKFVRGRRISFIKFRCPKCLASGEFRDKNPILFLFVKSVKIAPRVQFFGVVPSSNFLLKKL